MAKGEPTFVNFNQAKLSCSQDPRCLRILDQSCKGDELKICFENVDVKLPNTIEQIEGSCLHSKTEVRGIYNNIKLLSLQSNLNANLLII